MSGTQELRQTFMISSAVRIATLALVLCITCAVAQGPDKASVHIDRGIGLAHEGKFPEAAREFLSALAINPKLAEAHYLLGLVRQSWGAWGEARSSYQAALRLNPRYPEAQLGLAAVMTREADGEESWNAAIAACRKAIQLNPGEAEPHFHLATNEKRKGNFEAAAAGYETVLRLRPDYPGGRLALAEVLVELRAFDKAAPLLEAVAQAQADQALVHHLLGVVASKQARDEAAAKHLARASSLDPANPQTRYLLAMSLRKLGRADEAEVELRRFRELNAGKANAAKARHHLGFAQKLLADGKLTEAIGEYQESLSWRRDPGVAIDLGVALLRAKRIDEAIATFHETATEHPDSVLAQYHLGLAYAQKSDYENARKALQKSLELRPEFPEALFSLGMACAMQGQLADAEKYLRRSMDLRPDLAPTHYYLGGVLRELGRSSDAETEFQKARQLDPGFRPESGSQGGVR